jgi:hypothetical protein
MALLSSIILGYYGVQSQLAKITFFDLWDDFFLPQAQICRAVNGLIGRAKPGDPLSRDTKP